MSILRWQPLAVALISYIVVASSGYYLLVEPSPSRLIAIEIALSSLVGVGPRPLVVDELSNSALWFDIGALTAGFLLRLISVALVTAMFLYRAQKSRLQVREQTFNTMQISLKARRN